MIYTMQDCTDWRKLLLSHVDLLEMVKAAIIVAFPRDQRFDQIVKRR
jgi:hypothetical protein